MPASREQRSSLPPGPTRSAGLRRLWPRAGSVRRRDERVRPTERARRPPRSPPTAESPRVCEALPHVSGRDERNDPRFDVTRLLLKNGCGCPPLSREICSVSRISTTVAPSRPFDPLPIWERILATKLSHSRSVGFSARRRARRCRRCALGVSLNDSVASASRLSIDGELALGLEVVDDGHPLGAHDRGPALCSGFRAEDRCR